MLQKKPNKKVYLIGPFIGELEWEMYRFAPYVIHLKKENPRHKFIVYTRPNRFDLYGKHADILIPLNLKYEKRYKQQNFGLTQFKLPDYDLIQKFYYKKYSKRFDIIEHIVPDIAIWRNKIKWQFPRDKMNYDFQPRNGNFDLIEFLIDSTKGVFVTTKDSDIRHSLHNMNYNPLMHHWLKDLVSDSKDNLKTSFIGCLILYIRECKFVVGNMKNPICKLSLLLKTPVISINEKMSYDSIHLWNPFHVPVINCNNIEEGVEIYEDNF